MAAAVGLLSFAVPAVPAFADTPQVVSVRILKLFKTRYEIQVNVQHYDTSWDHFLDKWEVIGPGGRVLATRVFYYPHIGQPQRLRNLRGVIIPEGVEHIIIRVHDKVHGYGREKLVALPKGDSRDTGFK